MDKEIKQELKEIDLLIQGARGNEARERLKALYAKGIPFGMELAVARLARRAYLPEIGIKLLHALIRPTSRLKREPTDADRIEYAACLFRIGACWEADELLKKIDSSLNPEVLFFQAAIQIRSWHYEEAIPILRKYLAHPKLENYQRIVGKINLSLCLLHIKKFREAKSLLGEITEEASAQKLELIYANSIRMLGNLELARKEYESALEYFNKAETLLKGATGLDLFFSKKWIAITKYLLDPKNRTNRANLEKIRDEAQEIKHWESLRDIDFHKAVVEQKEELFEYLYFGTPLIPFQTRVKEEWKPKAVPNSYNRRMGPDKGKPVQIDFFNGSGKKGKDGLKAGQAMHRLYVTLCQDFYRPYSVPELYEKIFPGEYFSPETSELRVHQVILRLRRWFEDSKLPLEIIGDKGEYLLQATKPCDVTIRLFEGTEDKNDYRLNLMREKLGADFTLNEVADLFKMTRRGASEIVRVAVESGKLIREGKAKRTRYRFPNSDESNLRKAS